MIGLVSAFRILFRANLTLVTYPLSETLCLTQKKKRAVDNE